MTALTIIFLVFILLLALFILGRFLMKAVGKKGCAACDNRSCPLHPGDKAKSQK